LWRNTAFHSFWEGSRLRQGRRHRCQKTGLKLPPLAILIWDQVRQAKAGFLPVRRAIAGMVARTVMATAF
jgi:hypothetical protein